MESSGRFKKGMQAHALQTLVFNDAADVTTLPGGKGGGVVAQADRLDLESGISGPTRCFACLGELHAGESLATDGEPILCGGEEWRRATDEERSPVEGHRLKRERAFCS
jgi:hypothetical protein